MSPSPGESHAQHKPAKRKLSTLTPAQLERKRANDRETQRAIRARTRDYITYLEQEVEKLKIQEASSKTDDAAVRQLVQKNKALQDEIARLRQELSASVTPTTLAFPPRPVEHAAAGPSMSAFANNSPDWEDSLITRTESVSAWGSMTSLSSLAPPPDTSSGGGIGVQQAGPSRQYVGLPTCSNCNRCVSGIQVVHAPVTASLATGSFPPETVICEDCLHVLHNQGGLGSYNVVRRGI